MKKKPRVKVVIPRRKTARRPPRNFTLRIGPSSKWEERARRVADVFGLPEREVRHARRIEPAL